MKIRSYETVVIDNIEDFIREIVSSPGWNRKPCYRGLANAEWEIQPLLLRENLEETDCSSWRDLAASIMERFKKRAISELGYEPHSELEWCAMGQHHGLPTPFTAWSENALVAAWHATKPSADQAAGSVWRLVPGEASQTINNDFEQLPEAPRLYVPQRRSGTMLSQRCCFLSHPLPELDTAPIPFEEYYEVSDERWHLCQLFIPHYAKAELRERLSCMGVDSYAMRLGPGGLAAQIREESYQHSDSFEWAIDS